MRSEPRGDARQMRHPLHILVEEGAQPARSLQPLRQGPRGTLPTCGGDGQYRSGLPAGSGQTDAVPAKILQQLPGDTVAREEIWDRPAHGGCVCASQKSEYGYQALREVLEQGDDADFLPDGDGTVHTPVSSSPAPVHKNIRGREYYSVNHKENVKNDNSNENK